MHRKNFSSGWPFFSYKANKNHGNMTITMRNAAVLTGRNVFNKKKSGNPVAAAPPKHTVCLFVRPSMNFVFTRVKSFGIDT